MGLFSRGHKPSYPDRPVFSLAKYNANVDERQKYEEDVANQAVPRQQTRLESMLRQLQAAQEFSSARRGMLDSGQFFRNQQERSQAGESGLQEISENRGQTLADALTRSQQTKTAAAKWYDQLMSNYAQQYAQVKAARRSMRSSNALGYVMDAISVMSAIANPVVGIPMLGMKAVQKTPTSSSSGGQQKMIMPQATSTWDRRLNPYNSQYWGKPYYSANIRPNIRWS